MNIIEKITRSRDTLKEFLKEEWDTSTMPDFSNQEIETIYNIPSSKNKSIAQFGIASGCNFSLKHKFIPTYRLHIIYYNFPEIGKVSSKITKSACEKIKSLYSSELISPEDSLLIIINDNISESLESSFDELNISLQNDLKMIELNDSIIQEMNENNFPLEKKHFRNVVVLSIDSITNNLLQHRLVPKHTPIRDNKSIQEIISRVNSSANQLPIILKNDIISKYLRLSHGDICEIERTSIKSGIYSFYRICK